MTEIISSLKQTEEEEQSKLNKLYKRFFPPTHPVRFMHMSTGRFEEKESSKPSYLRDLPPEIMSMVFTKLDFQDIMQLRCTSKYFYVFAIVHMKKEQKKTVGKMEISRRTLQNFARMRFCIQTPIRYSIPLWKQEILNINVNSDKPGMQQKFWWNYRLADMGKTDTPRDFDSPITYRNRNGVSPVWDMSTTLSRHLMYFFADINLQYLRLNDLCSEDMDALADSIRTTQLTIFHVDIYQFRKECNFLDVLQLSRPQEIVIQLRDQRLPDNFWNTAAVKECDRLAVYGGQQDESHLLTDEFLNSLTCHSIDLDIDNRVTPSGILQFLKDWYTDHRKIKVFVFILAVSTGSVRNAIATYFGVEDQWQTIERTNKKKTSSLSIEAEYGRVVITEI